MPDRKDKPVRYQVVANTGETVGLPLETKEKAEEFIRSFDVKMLQELCPDTDLSTFSGFEIEPTTDY